jgi:hypothetical protein
MCEYDDVPYEEVILQISHVKSFPAVWNHHLVRCFSWMKDMPPVSHLRGSSQSEMNDIQQDCSVFNHTDHTSLVCVNESACVLTGYVMHLQV